MTAPVKSCGAPKVFVGDVGNGSITMTVHYTPNNPDTSTGPCDGPITNIVIVNNSNVAASAEVYTASQSTDNQATFDSTEGWWVHPFANVPKGTHTFNATQTAAVGAVNFSDVHGGSVFPK